MIVGAPNRNLDQKAVENSSLRFTGLMGGSVTEVARPIYWVDFTSSGPGDECRRDVLAEDSGDWACRGPRPDDLDGI